MKLIKQARSQHGFTIVELLIVIVIIAVLAAITIVAYNGLTNRAKDSAGQTAASTVIKKAAAYNAEVGNYPATTSLLTSAATTTSYYLTGVTIDAAALTTSNLPASPNEVNYYKCGTGSTTAAPTTAAGVTTQTGVRVDYWNYSSAAVASIYNGTTSGLIGTYNVGCGLST